MTYADADVDVDMDMDVDVDVDIAVDVDVGRDGRREKKMPMTHAVVNKPSRAGKKKKRNKAIVEGRPREKKNEARKQIGLECGHGPPPRCPREHFPMLGRIYLLPCRRYSCM